MKNILHILLFIVLLLFSCQDRHTDDEYSSQDKQVEWAYAKTYHKLGLTNELKVCFKSNNRYICASSGNEVLVFDQKFNLDTIISIPDGYIPFFRERNRILVKKDLIENGRIQNTLYMAIDSALAWKVYEPQGQLLYEDDDYIVSHCCGGEWGGAVFFADKQTLENFSFPSTCAISVHKTDVGYYVISSLGHMGGSYDIRLIPNPKELFLVSRDNKKCRWWTDQEGRDKISRDTLFMGTKSVSRGGGVTLVQSFMRNDKLYFINMDLHNQKTSLSRLDGDRLIELDSLFTNIDSYWRMSQRLDSGFLYTFNNRDASGFLEIKGDSLWIVEW